MNRLIPIAEIPKIIEGLALFYEVKESKMERWCDNCRKRVELIVPAATIEEDRPFVEGDRDAFCGECREFIGSYTWNSEGYPISSLFGRK